MKTVRKPAELVQHLFAECEIDQHGSCPASLELQRPMALRYARRTFYVCSCACHNPGSEFAPGIPWSD